MIRFSVVVPLFNKRDHIVRSLSSILSQNVKDFEVLVIDDGSTDDSVAVVNQWLSTLDKADSRKFIVIRQLNAGVSSARNLGVENAKAEYVAFLDADDYWESNHLFELGRLVDDFSDQVDVFSSYCVQMNEITLYPKLKAYSNFRGVVDFFKVALISNGFINSSNCCVKRSIAQTKPFPVGMKNYEDSVTWARWVGRKGFAFSPEPTSVYVISNAEASSNVDLNSLLTYQKILFEECDSNYYVLCFYFLRFSFIHGLYAKSFMTNLGYLYLVKRVMFGGGLLFLALLPTLFVPVSLINALKNIRKK